MTQATTRARSSSEGRRSQELTTDECWARLHRHREGRLGYLSGRGPRHVVVPYAVWQGMLVVRVPAYNEAVQYVGDRQITFDVSERVSGGAADERVEIVGRGRLDEAEGVVLDALPDEHWPADLPSRLLWLEADRVAGQVRPVGRPEAPVGHE